MKRDVRYRYWLTAIEVSERLDVDVRRVFALVAAGDLRAHEVGRTALFALPDVESAWAKLAASR